MNICVFGAASTKTGPEYIEAVEAMGKAMAERGHKLVYGAGAHGLMGAAARGFKAGGGEVTGVIPNFFRDEKIEAIFERCDELIFTETMAQRKTKMEELADAFVIVPGGIGTYEELFEVLTLKQLGRHGKPLAIYNIDGFYDPLEMMMYHGMKAKFIRANCQLLYLIFTDCEEMIDFLEHPNFELGMTVHELKDG